MQDRKSYSELIKLPTFEERFKYLKLDGVPCHVTFGSNRYLNQALYNSQEWKETRRKVIIRDKSCDMGCDGYEISKGVLVHHINPITAEDIIERRACVLDLDNLITVAGQTHAAIHYGDESLFLFEHHERSPNDTCPWRKEIDNGKHSNVD